jgi:hypothetical protein
MKPPLILLTFLSAATLLLGRPVNPDPAALPGSARPAADPAKSPRRMLEKGMPGETIIQLIGRPVEIAPLVHDEVIAEKWTYRRLVDERTVQEAATDYTIPAFIGFTASGPEIGTATQLGFHLKHVKTYQVTSLLMVDGKLVVAKQWREENQTYVN